MATSPHYRRKRPNAIGSSCNNHANDSNNNNKEEKSAVSAEFSRFRGRTASRKKHDASRANHHADDDDDDNDTPFCCLTIKVGTILAIGTAIFGSIFGTSRVLRHSYYTMMLQATVPLPPPHWIVSSKDAFGIAQKYQLDNINMLHQFNSNNHDNTTTSNNNNNNNNMNTVDHLHTFLIKSAALRNQFQQLYGRHARSLLGHGLSSILLDIATSTTSNADYDGLATLAQRLVDQRDHGRDEFRILVLGNAAAAGYGNYHSQAYSFLLQRLLTPSFQALIGSTRLTVTNLAMDGVSEFPLSWCLTSQYFYMQQQSSSSAAAAALPDVIIWDFPRSSVQQLEAFIRHWSLVASGGSGNGTSRSSSAAPLLIFREQWFETKNLKTGKKQRKKNKIELDEVDKDAHLTLLEYYRQANVLSDATLLVHEVPATRPFFEYAQEEALPPGLADWHKFGGPAGASSLDHIHPHLSLQQHELVAWLVTMHFLTALELVAARDLQDAFYNNATSSTSTTGNNKKKTKSSTRPILLDKKKRRTTMTAAALPKPLFLKNVEWMDDLSSSSATTATDGSSLQQRRKQQQCYTTLEYMVRDHRMAPMTTKTTTSSNDDEEAETAAVFIDEGHGQVQQVDSVYIPSNLHEVLLPLDGINSTDRDSATIGQDSDLLLPKSGQWYNHGWVLDMDAVTKRHKQRTRSSDFLGFADWKKSYFGAYGSGTLRLFLPVPRENAGDVTTASDAVKVLVLCELPSFNEYDEAQRPSDPGRFRRRLPKPHTSTASCTLREDVSISVSGIVTTTQALESIGSSTLATSLYHAPLQSHCRQVVIPPSARLTTRTQATVAESRAGNREEYGLLVELTVTNPRVVWNQGPCSLSHVIIQPQ